MNILHILPELNFGGVETAAFDTVKYMLRLGHKVVVVSNGGLLLKEMEALGAIHYKLPVHKKSLFVMLKMIPELSNIIKKEEIKIVHAHSRVPAWIAYFSSRKINVVFITTCHGYYRNPLFSQVMGWGKRVIVISNVIARHMIDDFKVPYERIRLIASGVDLEKFKRIPSENKRSEFNIGMVGRLTRIKGHLHFIKAMAKVARVMPNIKIWIVGDAPATGQAYKEEIEVLVKRLGLKHCTEFLGNQRDIPAVMSQLDVLVLATTVPEAFGRVIIEAQSCKVAVVATRVGGVVDIIEDGVTGLLTPPADPQSMSEAVIKLLKDPELALKLAQGAYKKVREKFSAEIMVKETLDVYRRALEDHKILIIKFSSLGDIILSTAAMRAIRKKFPRASFKISFLVGEESKELLLNCPYIDELLVCDLKNKDKGLVGLLKLGGVLRKKNFDTVIDLQNNRKSHILAYLSASPNRYGYNNKKFGALLNHAIEDNLSPMEPLVHQFRILEMLGIKYDALGLELWPTQNDKDYVDELLNTQWLSANQKIVGVNISASPRWETKNWPLEHLAKLCEGLGSRDIRVLVTGTDKDLETASILMNKIKASKVINACGKTSINQLAYLISKCSVYISSDSAPLHIAAAMQVPFVALFGPTDPLRHLPPAKEFILLKKDLECRPCYKTNCKDLKCMEEISPQEVLEAVNKLLK